MNGNERIIVIGGGPAGSAAATMLVRRGRHVMLFERERFPRDHVGESLLPASMPILEQLGVLGDVENAGFLKKWGATMLWGKEPAPWSWYFRETNRRYPHAYQVWRPRFDQLLLENARRAGVDVREGHHVHDVMLEGDRVVGVMVGAEGGESREERAALVIDASGQSGLIGRRLQLRQVDRAFKNIAVYGYFENADRLPGPDETNIFIESYEHGWFWSIPLHTGRTSVGAVVDSDAGRDGIRQLGAEAYFDAQIASTSGTRAMLSKARRIAGPFVLRDWSYVSQRVSGPGWILAGDAACFIDPLFSTGVHLALSSGTMAAALAHSMLADPAIAGPAGEVYQQLYYQQYSHFRELARLFYASNRTIDSYFWEARRILGDNALTPREAFVRATAGQSPRGYERSVLSHGDLPTAFADEVSRLEGERAGRAERFDAAFAAPGSGTSASSAMPRLVAGAKLERRPVLGDGEFVWGYVLTSPTWPEGVPLSTLVAWLVSKLDGSRTLGDVMNEVQRRAGDQAQRTVESSLAALRLLYIDGLLEGLP